MFRFCKNCTKTHLFLLNRCATNELQKVPLKATDRQTGCKILTYFFNKWKMLRIAHENRYRYVFYELQQLLAQLIYQTKGGQNYFFIYFKASRKQLTVSNASRIANIQN